MQVDLACKILDGAPFRDDIAKPLSVQRAKFEMKGGEFVARKKPKKKPKKPGAKVDKMLGWGGFDDQLNPTKASPILLHPMSLSQQVLTRLPSCIEQCHTCSTMCPGQP